MLYQLNPDGTYTNVDATLKEHVALDESRFSSLEHCVQELKSEVSSILPSVSALLEKECKDEHDSYKETPMSHEAVNVFGGEGGLASALPLLLADRSRNTDSGFGMGGGLVGGLILGALLRNGNGGLFGGGNGCEISPAQAAFDQSLMSGINQLTAAVPNGALSTQNAILAQTNELSTLANMNTLAILQSNVGVKDSVQLGVASVLANANNNTNSVLTAIQSVKDQASGYRISDLEQRLTVAQTAALEDRLHARSREVEVNVAQTVNQNQVQGQVQAQLQAQAQALVGLNHCLHSVLGDLQTVKQGQIIFNSGAMTASGTQAAANTKVA